MNYSHFEVQFLTIDKTDNLGGKKEESKGKSDTTYHLILLVTKTTDIKRE